MSLLLRDLDPWHTFEQRVLEIITIALVMLRELPGLPEEENALNRRLCQLIIGDACIEWERRTGFPMFSKPYYEAHNQPDPFDQERTSREGKRPDLQWQYRDTKSMEANWLDYTVECKRLGFPPSPTWILNRNYITEGILRFIVKDHGYGHRCMSGLMIGYVQSMEPADVLLEVNLYGAEHDIPEITLHENAWSESEPNRLDHQLNRPDLIPEQFSLRHLWIDIRHHVLPTDDASVERDVFSEHPEKNS